MLTKQEREATIERIKSYGDSDLPFYKLLFGSRAPYAMQYTEYLKALKDRIIDLCDTSNMVELPRDKDGEVIRIGDTVYVDGREWQASCVKYSYDSSIITVYSDIGCTVYRPDELTHKKPVTIASLVERIRDILDDDDDMTAWVFSELSHIADQLESLGDSDD